MIERDRLAASINLPRAEREQLRWLLLLGLWHARPYGANEDLLLKVAADAQLRCSSDMVRQELHSLKIRALVELQQSGPLWSAQLTPVGEDVVEGRIPAPSGIFRPAQW